MVIAAVKTRLLLLSSATERSVLAVTQLNIVGSLAAAAVAASAHRKPRKRHVHRETLRGNQRILLS